MFPKKFKMYSVKYQETKISNDYPLGGWGLPEKGEIYRVKSKNIHFKKVPPRGAGYSQKNAKSIWWKKSAVFVIFESWLTNLPGSEVDCSVLPEE